MYWVSSMRIVLFWASLVDMKEGYCTNSAFSLVRALVGFPCMYRIIKRDEMSQNVGQESHWEVRSRREKQNLGRLVKEGGPQQEIWRMKTLSTCRSKEASRPDGKQGPRLDFTPETIGLMCYLTTRLLYYIFMISLTQAILLAHWQSCHMLVYWFLEKLSFSS